MFTKNTRFFCFRLTIDLPADEQDNSDSSTQPSDLGTSSPNPYSSYLNSPNPFSPHSNSPNTHNTNKNSPNPHSTNQNQKPSLFSTSTNQPPAFFNASSGKSANPKSLSEKINQIKSELRKSPERTPGLNAAKEEFQSSSINQGQMKSPNPKSSPNFPSESRDLQPNSPSSQTNEPFPTESGEKELFPNESISENEPLVSDSFGECLDLFSQRLTTESVPPTDPLEPVDYTRHPSGKNRKYALWRLYKEYQQGGELLKNTRQPLNILVRSKMDAKVGVISHLSKVIKLSYLY